MSGNKYTLIGNSSNPLTKESSMLFVHVESATSVQDAQDQLQSVLHADASYSTFAGHLDPLDGGHALQLLSGGRLLDRPRSLPAINKDDRLVAIDFNGTKIYPTNFKGEPRWAVQADANRGTAKAAGDSLHKTMEEAKQEATLQARRAQSQAELAKSWEPKYLDASGKPLPEAIENQMEATEEKRSDARTSEYRRPSPFNP